MAFLRSPARISGGALLAGHAAHQQSSRTARRRRNARLPRSAAQRTQTGGALCSSTQQLWLTADHVLHDHGGAALQLDALQRAPVLGRAMWRLRVGPVTHAVGCRGLAMCAGESQQHEAEHRLPPYGVPEEVGD